MYNCMYIYYIHIYIYTYICIYSNAPSPPSLLRRPRFAALVPLPLLHGSEGQLLPYHRRVARRRRPARVTRPGRQPRLCR